MEQVCKLNVTENVVLRKYEGTELLEVIELTNGKIVSVIKDKEELKKWL